MTNLQNIKTNAEKMFTVKWVKRIHEGTKPAETPAEKSLNILIGAITKHCAQCLNLNGCCFVENEMPKKELHINCHCKIIHIPSITATAHCPIEKFTKYVFAAESNKKHLFELWGYSIIDSEYLKREFERQARLAYSIGEYDLKYLDAYGQRINITINLNPPNQNRIITFCSGWMVYPNGKIILTTPYGGK